MTNHGINTRVSIYFYILRHLSKGEKHSGLVYVIPVEAVFIFAQRMSKTVL